METIPEEFRETNSLVELQQHETTIKTLGVFWNAAQDKYLFTLNLPPDMPGTLTKRRILSQIAKIYDPLGWLAPVIISCKIFMQTLWQLKADWDDILPADVQDKWMKLRESLTDICNVQLPRCVIPSPPKFIYLIGASDASTKAISAAVYICCVYEDHYVIHLLTAKTRVAPLRDVTLPLLELNGAVVLSELLSTTLKALQRKFDEIRCFTDSMITLHWIQSSPSRWKNYVKRRVQLIQDNVPTAIWYHIPGDQNPADCASRGITATQLLHHPLWWNGSPAFLNPTTNCNELLAEEITQLEVQQRPVKTHFINPKPLHPLFTKYSSFNKLQRVVAYVIRFLNNWCARRRKTSLQLGPLTNEHLPTTSPLLKLQPVICKSGMLRVGGRLRHANIPEDQKHQILLPKGHHVTTCIIWDHHIRNFHAGPAATLASIQHTYWITNGRDVVRYVLKKCTICCRHRATMMKQVMGDLPASSVNPSRPFSKSGVDYAGPFHIRPMVRSKVTLKCWIAIFVCFSTRAIHVEVVSSLSTDCFLAALRRFISRRGLPSDIYSDCGTNFKGADTVLREFFSLCRTPNVQDELTRQQIQWHFNPAGAPHFGGLWEAGVKSIKHHLHRVIGSARLTYEEFQTFIIQIEGILNSRPLIPASTDPADLSVLTPAHFLIGEPINAFPEPNLTDMKENHLQRWKLIQQRQQHFWKRWSSEFITRLQQRPKWLKPSPELQVGQLVIIKDERLPPLVWKLGRVIAVHPGADDHVRVATLKTADGELKRPIVKLCVLPF